MSEYIEAIMEQCGPAPPPPEIGENKTASSTSASIPRRTLILGGGALLLSGEKAGVASYRWHELDDRANELVYPSIETSFGTVGTQASPRELGMVPQACVFLGGLGQGKESCAQSGQLLADTVFRGSRVSFSEYNPQGIDIAHLTDTYEELERRTQALDIVTNSMGLTLFQKILEEKQRRHTAGIDEVPHRPITAAALAQARSHLPRALRSLTLNCSPLDVTHTYAAPSLELFSHLAPEGSLSEKFLFELVSKSVPQHGQIPRRSMGRALRATFNKQPSKMDAQQLVLLGQTHISDITHALEAVLTPDSALVYAMPTNPHHDRLVKVTEAATRARQLTERIGCSFDVITYEGGHADVGKLATSGAYKRLGAQWRGVPI